MTARELCALNPLLADLHIHTSYCDGLCTARDMIESAISKGLTTVGIVAHSYVEFDKACRIEKDDIPKMKKELDSLQKEYADRISVLRGIEADYFGECDPDDYDYVIGSVHYFKRGESYLPVDKSRKSLTDAVNEYFGGDFLLAAEEYYAMVSEIVERTGAQIVGHFDLIAKFNEGDALFDTSHPRYVRAYRAAADALIESGAVFEINTGAMSRGYRTAPYPSEKIADYIKSRGGRLLLSSDAHKAENVAYAYGTAKGLLP